MRCSIISPRVETLHSGPLGRSKNGTVPPIARAGNAHTDSGGNGAIEQSALDRRCTAPLRLSAALRSQLPRSNWE